MKAILRDRYGSPDVLRVADVDRPEPFGDEVLVRVEAASLNTADLDHLRGLPHLARLGTGLGRPRSPRTGLDVAGRVEAVGPDVTELRPGDEVWADLFAFGHGSFAEYVCAPARAFSPKPTGATFEEAAAVPHSGVLALQALTARGPIQPGQEVLVNGAGGCVGPFAVQIARSMGATVTGVDHGGKLDLVRKMGADHVVDYTRDDVTRSGRRYDLIVDIAANRSPLRFLRAMTPRGRYVLIARTLGGFARAAVLGGLVTLLTGRRMGVFAWVPNRHRDLEVLARLIDTGEVRPLLDQCYPLEEVPAAFERLAEGAARGKLVVIPDPTRTEREAE